MKKMVKRLSAYVGKEVYVSFDAGEDAFPSELILKKDPYGNNVYYLKTFQGETIKIHSRGKKRVARYDGVFILDRDRKWNDIVKFMNEKDKLNRA